MKSKYPRMEQGSQQLAAGSASLEAGINQLVKIMETGDTITVGEGQKMQVPSLVNTCKALATEISQLNGMASLDSLTTLDNTKLEAAKNALEAEKDKISPDDYNAIKAVLDQQTDNNATIASNNTKITADNKEIDKYNKSVSYTHLDVYKRQDCKRWKCRTSDDRRASHRMGRCRNEAGQPDQVPGSRGSS